MTTFRNNILLTFSDYDGTKDIGIYKKKGSREIIPVEKIDFISNESKEIARNLVKWIIDNDIDSIYNYERNDGIFNHIAIRNNERNEFLIEFYFHEINQRVINLLKYWNLETVNIKSIYYQLEHKNKNNFRDNFFHLGGNRYLYYKVCEKIIGIKAGSFFQTNNNILHKVYNDLRNLFVKDKDIFLLDFYCGVGVISIIMSEFYKKCIGVEINQNAIDVAEHNCQLNNCNNITFYCSEVENFITNLKSDNKFVIFVNPPRSGLKKEVINKINSIDKNLIIQIMYLSCCKKTLERDLSIFNFKHEIIKEYDMFPQTNHKEYLVSLF